MSRPYEGSSGLLLIIFVFSLAGFLIWDQWKRQNKTKQIPITYRRILWIACVRRYLWVGILNAVLICILFLMYMYEAMGFGALTGSIFVLLFVNGMVLLFPVLVLSGCMHILRRLKRDFDARFSGKVLDNRNGRWKYRDKDWYISVGNGSCAVLYAAMIDFEQPVQRCNGYGAEKIFNHDLFEFAGREGERIYALLTWDEELRAWIKEHEYRPMYHKTAKETRRK